MTREGVDHRLSSTDANVHHEWDRSLDPVLTVESGAVVEFECRDAIDGQLTPDSTAEDVLRADTEPIHPLTGPVAVAGAEPGDVLEVELLSLSHEGIGYSWFYPESYDKGLLPEAFDDPGLFVWELDGDTGTFVDDIEIPLAPFPGVVGVAPAAAGSHSTTPPRMVGGNVDIKHLTAGSTVYLPVEVAGALFSIGDCHAAQGDGEVCVTGIEAPMSVTARLSVRSEFTVEAPRFETTGPFTPTGRDEPMYGTTGISDDLLEATKSAVRHMMSHLEDRGLSSEEAYVLCSAVVDLKINEVVNSPNVVVSAYLPESIFP